MWGICMCFMYIHRYTRLCMWRQRSAWLCAYMEVFLHCVYWETRSLTKLEFAVWLGQWDLLVSMSSALGLYSTTLSCQAFMGILTRSPCFQGSHLTDGVVSPVHLLHHL